MAVGSRFSRLSGLALAMLLLPAPDASAQRAEAVSAARVRALAREAEARFKSDPSELVLALDRRFRETWGDFESFPVSIVRQEAITISLTTPYMGYRRALVEHLRMRRPIAEVPWVEAAIVNVELNRVDAPDVLEIVVERDGARIPPTTIAGIGGLKPMTFQNGNGQTAILHAGVVAFPIAAFAPGATVVVTARPAAGDPMSMTFDSRQLRELK
jgi:hypothetical protein